MESILHFIVKVCGRYLLRPFRGCARKPRRCRRSGRHPQASAYWAPHEYQSWWPLESHRPS